MINVKIQLLLPTGSIIAINAKVIFAKIVVNQECNQHDEIYTQRYKLIQRINPNNQI